MLLINYIIIALAHKNMIGEFKLFSSNWNKLDITVVNGSEPKPIKNIIFNLVLDKDVPKGQTVELSYQTLDKRGTAIVGKTFYIYIRKNCI